MSDSPRATSGRPRVTTRICSHSPVHQLAHAYWFVEEGMAPQCFSLITSNGPVAYLMCSLNLTKPLKNVNYFSLNTGGEPGRKGRNIIYRHNGSEENLGGKFKTPVSAGVSNNSLLCFPVAV